MQLSDTENKMVARLRKEQQLIIRLRWVRLLVAIVGLAACVYCEFTLIEVVRSDPDQFSLFLVALISPFICLIFLGIHLQSFIFCGIGMASQRQDCC